MSVRLLIIQVALSSVEELRAKCSQIHCRKNWVCREFYKSYIESLKKSYQNKDVIDHKMWLSQKSYSRYREC